MTIVLASVAALVAAIVVTVALTSGSSDGDGSRKTSDPADSTATSDPGNSDEDDADAPLDRPTIPIAGETAPSTVPVTEPPVPTTAAPAPPTTPAPPPPTTAAPAPPTLTRFEVGQCLTAPAGPFEDPVVVDCAAPDAANRVTAVADGAEIDCPPPSGTGPVVKHSTTRSNEAGSVSFSWCTEPNV